MNATKSPVDLLLNIESPSINLAQRRGLSHASDRSSEVSALNRKEKIFDDVYRQQRREDAEVRQQERPKREVERAERADNRPSQTAQNAAATSARTEKEGAADGKDLPRNDASANQKTDAVTAQAEAATEADASKDAESTQTKEQQAAISFDDLDVLAEVKAAVEGAAKEVENQQAVADIEVEPEVAQSETETADIAAMADETGDKTDSGGGVDETTMIAGEGEQDAEVGEQSSQAQASLIDQESSSEEPVTRQEQIVANKQTAKVDAEADASTRSSSATAVSDADDKGRDTRQSRVAESVELSAKTETTSGTPTKAHGGGTEQAGQPVQDRFANLMGTSDFKALREQLAANTVKVEGANVAAKAAAVDGAAGADAAGDRQPRLNGLLQASQAVAQAKPGVVTASVQTPMGSPEWGQAMSQRIMWLANRGINAAELHLNPRDLGPVDVRINVSGEQATVHFSSPQAGVREALESSVVRLREMLESNGINLADVDVSDQSQSEQAQANAEGRSGSGNGGDHEAGEQTMVEPVLTRQIESEGLVDFYA